MSKVAVFVTALLAVLATVLISTYNSIWKDRVSYNKNQDSQQTEFDFIVVGAGTAGSVLASRLSELHNKTVLLLEAGDSDNYLNVKLPVAFSKLFKTNLDWEYYTEEEPHANNRKLFWPRGKMLGGCSSNNAMIYIRGSPFDYDSWEKLGNPGWSYEQVLPYFMKSEGNTARKLHPKYHNKRGEWKISNPSHPHELTRFAIKAASQILNVPIVDDFNGASQLGVGFLQRNIYKGKRHSLADAFLNRQVMKRKNFFVRTGAQATRVLFDKERRAIGVEFVNLKNNNKKEIVRAREEVILSGGAINSPQLLMLSGIGPEAHLKKFGIELVHNLPGVGQNLQDHLQCGVLANITKPMSIHSEETALNFARWFFKRSGPFTSNLAEGSGFYISQVDSKKGELAAPDMQFLTGPLFFYNHGFTKFNYSDGVALGGVLLTPRSVGRIELASADALQKPKIFANYFENKEDLDRLVELVRLARKMIKIEPIASIVAAEVLPGPSVDDSYEQIAQFVRESSETLYHPTSTCKMGPESDKMAVVDSELKVYGVKGLRVVDASIMPTIVRGNTNAPTVMIAEKAADMIKQAHL